MAAGDTLEERVAALEDEVRLLRRQLRRRTLPEGWSTVEVGAELRVVYVLTGTETVIGNQ